MLRGQDLVFNGKSPFLASYLRPLWRSIGGWEEVVTPNIWMEWGCIPPSNNLPHSSSQWETCVDVEGSYAAPPWVTLHPSELQCTLWAMLYPNELGCTLLSCAFTSWTILLLLSYGILNSSSFFCIFFGRARVCRPLFRLCRPFMIFEGCLDSNPEYCRSKPDWSATS